jgi:hypothetical protein
MELCVTGTHEESLSWQPFKAEQERAAINEMVLFSRITRVHRRIIQMFQALN